MLTKDNHKEFVRLVAEYLDRRGIEGKQFCSKYDYWLSVYCTNHTIGGGATVQTALASLVKDKAFIKEVKNFERVILF